MVYKKIATVRSGQDGAIFKNTLFRFNAKGDGRAYAMDDILSEKYTDTVPEHGEFRLDRTELACPHCNAVFFGKEKFSPEDEFPLLYANIYNNYSKEQDRRPGQLAVYRLTRKNSAFSTTLLQIIQVAFAYDTELWMSYRESDDPRDVRPYGNFVADPEKGILYGFVMRDREKITRYFSFRLPALSEGFLDPVTGIRLVLLSKDDVLDFFDAPYHRYIQGACFHNGRIYSTEGFGEKEQSRSAIRIIDVEKKCQLLYVDLVDAGLPTEPEWIDFHEGICYYSHARGELFQMNFEI